MLAWTRLRAQCHAPKGARNDSANQLIRENNQAANKTWTWEYDSIGNILCKKEYAYTTGALGTLKNTKEYKYESDAWGQLLTSYGNESISYGVTGNIYSPSVVRSGENLMSWEHGHQLSYIRNGTSSYYYSEYYYTYDANGMRTKKVIDYTDWVGDTYVTETEIYEYTYNGTQLTRMTHANVGGRRTMDFRYNADGSPLCVHFTHIAYEFDEDLWEFLGEETAYTCCEGTYYYITNLQGDVVALVDESGNLAATYTYDAWGRIISTGYLDCIASDNPLRYRGYVYDIETGFYYLQSRYYDPVKGRFISPDAFVSTGQGILGHNMFAYCLNNPVNYIDSTGHMAMHNKWDQLDCCGGSFGGSGGAVAPMADFTVLLNGLVAALTALFTTRAVVATRVETKEEAKTDVYIDAKTVQKKQSQYWEAVRVGNNVVIGDSLTFVEASTRVACGLDVMCASRNAAKWIVVVNCYWNAVGPEIHGEDGYYWHYHPHRNSHIHIWYFGAG